ncbi:MAG: hypothetical protein ABIT37_05230 [Luteolibacter sp.]
MKKLLLLISIVASTLAFGGTSGIWFIYQPLTAMGTEGDSGIIIAKIPVIANAVPESVIGYLSSRNKLLQRKETIADDSNLLSLLGISVGGEWNKETRHYVATLDLSTMKSTKPFELTEEAVVEAAVDCIRRTIDELGQETPWQVRIVSRDNAKWSKYEGEYLAKAKVSK